MDTNAVKQLAKCSQRLKRGDDVSLAFVYCATKSRTTMNEQKRDPVSDP
jgi:hypothetical protein